jgi:hypothetical protein
MSWIFGIIMRSVLPNRMIVEKLHEVALNGEGRSILSEDVPVTNHVFRYNGVDYPVRTFTAKIQYVHATRFMASKRYEVRGDSGERVRVMHSHGLVGGHQIKMLFPMGAPGSRGIIKVLEDPEARQDSLNPKKKWRLTPNGWTEESLSE